MKLNDNTGDASYVFCKVNQPNGYLSNWWAAPFELDGIVYPTTEHHMMYQKAILMGDQDVANLILRATSPAEVKSLGRQVRNFDARLWDDRKFEIVLAGNLAKFRAYPLLAQALLATGDHIIAEAADYDRVWGIGLSAADPRAQDQSQWRGQNLLGKVLMEVRRQLRA
jgi:ribA/ribD-fused uncharacterized protein